MKNEENKREFSRVPLQIEVEVSPGQQPIVVSQTKDVSLKGLYLVCDSPLPLGSDCRVALLLGGGDNPVRIEVSGKIARVDSSGMGLEITEIIGTDSFDHLRNLVLYNAANADQVEEEFHSHLGLKRREPEEK